MPSLSKQKRERRTFGQYHYDFFGTDQGGRHSNHMQVMVTIAPDSGR